MRENVADPGLIFISILIPNPDVHDPPNLNFKNANRQRQSRFGMMRGCYSLEGLPFPNDEFDFM